MIKLFQFPPAFGLPNASPFCMKVETYLRMAGLPYECPRGASHFKAPKGKLPYIEDGDQHIADSSFIIEYLKQTYGDALDAHLNEAQRAWNLAVRRMVEEHLYWAILHSRWIDEAGFAIVREAFFSRLPLPVRAVLPHLARRGIRQQMHGQGLGRHSRDEIYAVGCADIAALAALLDAREFFAGSQPCSLDATTYAFLANILWAPLENPLRQEAMRHASLEAYCRRMKARYYD